MCILCLVCCGPFIVLALTQGTVLPVAMKTLDTAFIAAAVVVTGLAAHPATAVQRTHPAVSTISVGATVTHEVRALGVDPNAPTKMPAVRVPAAPACGISAGCATVASVTRTLNATIASVQKAAGGSIAVTPPKV
jgi:hypothetical protein